LKKTGSNENCFDIARLLHEMLQTDSLPMDIYLELPFKGKSKQFPSTFHFALDPHNLGYLAKIGSIFGDCLYEKKYCQYKSSRFHYIDTRYTFTHPSIPSLQTENQWRPESRSLDFYLIQRIQKSVDDLSNKKYIDTTNKLITFFYGNRGTDVLWDIWLTSKNYVLDILDMLNILNLPKKTRARLVNLLLNSDIVVERDGYTFHRIGVQVYELQNRILGEKIVTFIKNELIDVEVVFEKWLDMYKKGRFDVSELQNIVIFNESLQVDAYTLPRMFRNFKPDGNRVFVYAGVNHIKRYRKFFEEYLGVNVISSVDKDFRCQRLPRHLFGI